MKSVNEISLLNQSSIGSSDNYDFINYLDTSSITKGKIDSWQNLTENFPSRAKRKVRKNTIIYSTVRPNQEHYGFFENLDKENSIVSTGFTTIDVITSEVFPKYLYYLLTQKWVINYLQTIAENSVSAYPSINPSDIGDLKFDFPDLETQIQISETLSTIDQKIAVNNSINDNLEQQAKTLYDYWFVQNADENWEVKTLDDIGNIIGGSTPSKNIESYFTYLGIPWITPKDLSLNIGNKFIQRGETDITETGKASASLNILPRGTVLMSSRAPIGYLAIARNDVTTNQGFKSFIPKSYFSTEFVYYTLQNRMPIIERNASGSTFKEISTSILRTIPATIPPKDIVLPFTNTVKPIFSKQELLEEENQQLSRLRDFLLPMLMNGQVTVR